MLKKNNQRIVTLLGLCGLSFVLFSCGGDRKLQEGVFIDSRVEGLQYRTDSVQDITDENGIFNYRKGEAFVRFFIGNVDLGAAPIDDFVTPLDIVGTTDVEDQRVINRARFLLLFDEDYDETAGNLTSAENGIKISDETREALALYDGPEIDFDVPASTFFSSGAYPNLVADITGSLEHAGSISSDLIATHLRNSLDELGANDPPEVTTEQGNISVTSGEDVELVGNATDPDGTIESAKWSQLSGDPDDLLDGLLDDSNPVEETVTFTAPTVDTESEYDFKFSATDDDGESRSALVTVTVSPSS